MALNEHEANGKGIRRTGRKGGHERQRKSTYELPPPARRHLERLLAAVRAASRGDFEVRISAANVGHELVGEIDEAFNELLERNAALARELVRVGRVVGREGRLSERVSLGEDVEGGWAACVGAINALIGDLMRPTTELARVIGAVASGDLSQKMALEIEQQPLKGEFLDIGKTVNAMVAQLNAFAAEVARVAKEVGTDGKLGGQADVRGVSGVWKDLTDNVNGMASNLTTQVRGIVKVVTAVANGDLTQRLEVNAKGEVAALADTLNGMTKTLGIFAEQVINVARTVGVEGKLGAQAQVPNVAGSWKDLTDNVNLLANNLTSQVRNIVEVTTAVANGDLSRKISVDARGEVNELKNTINTMVDQLRSFASEVTRVAREVGIEGELGGQADVKGVSGTWKDLTDNVNVLAANLTDQVRNIAKVTTAVANGDLSQKITVSAKGEVLELKNTINTMVDQLRAFAGEVTRVAKEVGTEGKLGGQAQVPGVSGTWKDLTDNVNFMARNLTTQVRGIVKVVTAVANGELSQKLIGVEAKGEIAALADTINNMCDTLGTFADQVSTVAREVGIEGKLGGQAKVPGAMGTWRQLTDNVNQLAANLTGQVRAISDVATAVTKGDLTRSIDVQAEGEVALLKDNINQMILNLRETTQKNTEQDWLKTNLARFSSMMQGQKDLQTVSEMIMSELTPLVSAHQGAFFIMEHDSGTPTLVLRSTYAYRERKNVPHRFRIGEGLVGQCARERKPIVLTRVPADYIQISSGLGESPPLTIIVLPVLFEGEVMAVVELASFHPFSQIHQLFLDQLAVSIGVVLNMITASMRTEQLLQQSQGLTQELQDQSKELQSQQDELRRTNLALEKQALELEEKARLLAEQNEKVEIKNREVEQARCSLEEKAEQLALASKYKSEFLANMSHELRTPLNSLLILARLLADNPQSNLTGQQVDYARTIYASGADLLSLINEILDLSKVEAGKMAVDPRAVLVEDVVESIRRSCEPLADQKRLSFVTETAPGTIETIVTDSQRVQQVLKNLLSNAFKFTDQGAVTLRVGMADPSRLTRESLRTAARVVAFEVTDTGIGIPEDKQKLIFEAFQQADGTTNRRYGGTGLGLSISREISRLLGGEIQLKSKPGRGSTFTLYLPESIGAARAPAVATRLQAPTLPESVLTEASSAGSSVSRPAPIEDDRESLRPGDRVLLVIEDDEHFARTLMAMARMAGFKVVVATRGDTGLALAAQIRPSAITLDLELPVYDGWTVFDRLKRDPLTRDIPVQVITIREADGRGAALDAFAYLEKPVTKEALDGAFAHLRGHVVRAIRLLLLVEDNDTERDAVTRVIQEAGGVEVTAVQSAEEAVFALEQQVFDCMIVDLVLPGLDGISLLAEVRKRDVWKTLPIVVYTGKDLAPDEETKLKQLASSVVVKSGLASLDQLADQTKHFLRRVTGETPHDRSSAGGGAKTVLVVDDDARNIFALSSALETAGHRVVYAENGRTGIQMLSENTGIDVILMDIMMPVMDGYETIRAIREDPRYAELPIIAVTAKAPAEDRERCLAAGASDHVSKPVDTSRLLECIAMLTARRGASIGVG